MIKYSIIETKNIAELLDKVECLQDLNCLITTEGCKEVMPFFINNEIVLNMDKVERIIATKEDRDMNKSMDSALLITNNMVKEILLVEFRFNYINMRNLKRDSLTDKVQGSSNNFKGMGGLSIHNKYFFIFNPNIKQQAINRFQRMHPRLLDNYVPIDISDLKLLFF